jgi:hypothetical protein
MYINLHSFDFDTYDRDMIANCLRVKASGLECHIVIHS